LNRFGYDTELADTELSEISTRLIVRCGDTPYMASTDHGNSDINVRNCGDHGIPRHCDTSLLWPAFVVSSLLHLVSSDLHFEVGIIVALLINWTALEDNTSTPA
jgi:hypothetical protein